jgi:hypothetical protein
MELGEHVQVMTHGRVQALQVVGRNAGRLNLRFRALALRFMAVTRRIRGEA